MLMRDSDFEATLRHIYFKKCDHEFFEKSKNFPDKKP